MNAVPTTGRAGEVWARLASVIDPELDESVTELSFVTAVDVAEDGAVHIGFRLPTYWCAANFAYLMAADMRAAVAALPWVTQIAVSLDEHMYAQTINRGMARNLSFEQAFGSEADGDLESLRRVFYVKAFQRRQEALITHLLKNGMEPERVTALTVEELVALSNEAGNERLIGRYLERRTVCVAETGETALAFIDTESRPLNPATLDAYLRALRRVGINAEFNSALCRGLLAARYDDAACEPPHIEEKPLVFMPRTRDSHA